MNLIKRYSILGIIPLILVISILVSSAKAEVKPYSIEVPASIVEEVTPLEVVTIAYPTPPAWVPHWYIVYVIQECDRQGVPYLLVFKLIERESGWNFEAKNHNRDPKTKEIWSTDYGRFQINSLNFKNFVEMYKDPDRASSSYDLIGNSRDNAQIGIRHLADLYKEFGNWTQVVQAYNTGSYRVRKSLVKQSTLKYQQYIIPVEGWWLRPPNVILVREEDA